MTSISFTIDDDELGRVVVRAIDDYFKEASGPKATTSDQGWLQTGPMAKALGISVRTIHAYRTFDQSPWIEGRHYKRSTPASNSRWIWDRDLTITAWQENSK